jgi:glycosyltransferase involved in cell wall biosynthesis
MGCKISVIVPVFNTAEYLEECIASLIKQTIQETEIIVVDDGSTDNSWEILTKLKHGNEALKIFRKENGGQGSARNMALDSASGEYVLFVDSDDWIDPLTCSTLYNEIELSGSDVLCFNYILSYPSTERVICRYNEAKIWEAEQCLNAFLEGEISGHACNKLYKRSFLEEHNLRFINEKTAYEDLLFSIQVLFFAQKIRYIPDAFYHYRVRELSTSQSTDIKLVDQLYMLNLGAEFLEKENAYGFYKKKLDKLFSVTFVGILKRVFDTRHEKPVLNCLKSWKKDVSLSSLNGYEFILFALYRINYVPAKLFFKYFVLKIYPVLKKLIPSGK